MSLRRTSIPVRGVDDRYRGWLHAREEALPTIAHSDDRNPPRIVQPEEIQDGSVKSPNRAARAHLTGPPPSRGIGPLAASVSSASGGRPTGRLSPDQELPPL
jgi:hypothetical protein